MNTATGSGLAGGSGLMLFATVGSDYHPFHRFVQWLDAWLADLGPVELSCLIQVGTSRRPRFAEWRSFLSPSEIDLALRNATIAVCHGGPGSIMECRRNGLRPIVVPRRRRLGEIVDDHQEAFARRMAGAGEIALANDERRFRELLDSAVTNPEAFRTTNATSEIGTTVLRIEALVGQLLGKRR